MAGCSSSGILARGIEAKGSKVEFMQKDGNGWCSSVQNVGGITSGWLFFGFLSEEVAVDGGGECGNRQRVGQDELISFKNLVKSSNSELEDVGT